MDKAIAYDEGVADGISQGIKQNKVDITKEMIFDGIDIDTIRKYTKLSIEEVEKIKNELEIK